MPLRTQQWIQHRRATKTEARHHRSERRFHKQLRSAIQRRLGQQWRRRGKKTEREKQPKVESPAQVSPTFLQVCIRGIRWQEVISVSDTCTRSDPLQVKRRQHVTAIADSVLPHITNPLLILFGGRERKKKCDATKTGARVSFTRADPACQEAKRAKKTEDTEHCEMCRGCGAVKKCPFESACC